MRPLVHDLERISRLADEDNENDEYHVPVPLLDIWAEYRRLSVEEGWTQRQIAKAKGVQQSLVAERLAYAMFPQQVLAAMIEHKPRHDLRYTRVHFSRPYPVRSNSNSTNCCAEKALRACRWRVCGRYTTKDSWGVSGMSAPCGEAKRVG